MMLLGESRLFWSHFGDLGLQRKIFSRRGYAQLARVRVRLEESAQTTLESEGYMPRKHPGAFYRGTVVLPNEAYTTAKAILKKTEHKDTIIKNGIELANYLYCRTKPVEGTEYRDKCNQVESQVRAEDEFLKPFLSEAELEQLEAKRFNQTKNILKKTLYNWQPISYTGTLPFQYLTTRFAPEYAVLYKIFYEIATRDSTFKPRNLMDFGSGIGSAMWAANAFWNDSLNEHLCVDGSGPMNDLAESILRGGVKNNQTIFHNVYFRQFLPTSPTLRYDLVTSAYSLIELPSRKSRLQTLGNLWRKTSKYLLIVERGNNAGFEVLNEARDFLLKLDRGGSADCHIFSPCPHDTFCGRYTQDTKPCCFPVTYRKFHPFDKQMTGREKYSYFVIKKEPRSNINPAWPRLLEEPMGKPRHVICRLCMPDGSLGEAVVTKSRHSKIVYQTARRSRVGDLLPLQKSDLEDSNEADFQLATTDTDNSANDEGFSSDDEDKAK